VIDPYRTLGLAPGASVPEIKRAYRRLVKEHHPDSAGSDELPRFLSIQAAYEMLMRGQPGAAGRTGRNGPRSESGPGPAWRADPGRARATRDAWRRRARGHAAGTTQTTGSAGPARTADEPDAGGNDAGERRRGASSGRKTGGPAGDGSRRRHAESPRHEEAQQGGSRRATPGSTSYDDAVHEPFEPDWAGSSWYGQSSGTYWTINPREYADPRKHGPEYQARARRAAQAAGTAPDTGSADEDPDGGQGAEDGSWTEERPGAWSWTEGQAPERDPAAPYTATGSAARPYRGGNAKRQPRSNGPGIGDQDRSRHPGDVRAPHSHPSSHSGASGWTASARDLDWRGTSRPDPESGILGLHDVAERIQYGPASPRGRLVLALAGWPPIGMIAALAIGELSGCARFAASCESVSAASSWIALAQVAILAVLLLVTPLARVAAFGSMAILLAALPVVAFLTATGATYAPEPGAAALLMLLGGAWAVGIALGSRRRSRRMAP
jgi:hypothetical protein